MIYFNGAALEAAAPVMIEDIRVSPIQMTATARQLPINWGAAFVRMTGGSRTVNISFGLPTDNRDTRAAQLAAITRWARSDKPKRLLLPYHDGRYLDAICTGLPEPSTRQWWESTLKLTFTTFDNPYWTSIDEKSAAVGTAFTVLGDAPPLMQVRHTYSAQATNAAFSDGTNTMTFSTIPAGDFVLDLNDQTAAVGGTSIMDALAFTSSFILPHTGAMTITGAGTVYWRERWE